MKILQITLALAMAIPAIAEAARDPNDPFGTRAKEAQWYKEHYEHAQVDNSHREIIQKDLNRAVAMQNEVDEKIRNAPKLTPAELMSHVCREAAMAETIEEWGSFRSNTFHQKYSVCLELNRGF